MERRLAAILAADVAGYSRLMGVDEEGTLATLTSYRKRFEKCVGHRGGRVFGSVGDSLMAEFSSPVEAVRCAVEFQNKLEEQNEKRPEDRRMQFRVGVNLGDVMAQGDNLIGDGVNIAARLQALAPSGGICISSQIADQIAGKVDVVFANVGDHELKNISRPVEVWTWPPERANSMRRPSKFWLRAAAFAGLVAVGATATYFTFAPASAPDLPTGARIALIPFENVGENPDDAFFSEGLTRDVNALLAKFSNLFVIAPEAGAAYRDDPNCETIRKDLGADYILTGTVQRSADQLRVTTTFTDAQTCRQLPPPGPFDSDLSVTSVLDIQFEIARKIAALVGSSDAPLFNAALQKAIRDKAPENLEAYECYLLGFWFYQSFSLEAHRKARDCLLRTVEAEPGYSLGWSRLAFNYLEAKKRSYDTPADWEQLARAAAAKALDADRDNADAHYALAILSRMVGEDMDVYRALAQRAIDLNPNDSWILADLGTWLAYSGEWEKGEEWISRARELNPKLHPGYNNPFHLHAFVRGDYEEARNIRLNMGPVRNYMGMASLTASYAMNGEQQKAEELLARIREETPDSLKDPRAPFRARGMPTELIEGLMEGLRKAGLDVPEAASGD
ncbi:MAG: hypothetical protein GY947_21145 [Rhodobacteraceae bacterium]|nr:hypothetical protein [Paracoccaceae bacterium]